MDQTISNRSRVTRITSRVSTLVIALVLSVVGATSSAHAATGLTYRGDFSYDSTKMKRLAVCAYVEGWLQNSETASKLTRCNDSDNNAATNPKYDTLEGWAANLIGRNGVLIEARKVSYQGGNCPKMLGYQYVKCYYLGGKGTPVMTVSESSNASFAGGMALISWYYQ